MKSRAIHVFCTGILIGAFSFSAFSVFIPYIDYAFRYETINKELCRDKKKVVNQCNGFCQLSEKMKQTALFAVVEREDGGNSDFDTSHLPPPPQKLEFQSANQNMPAHWFFINSEPAPLGVVENKFVVFLETPTPPPRIPQNTNVS